MHPDWGTKTKPVAVFDLDGTIALIDHRRHMVEGAKKDWRGFFAACVDDEPNKPVIRIMRDLIRCGYEVIIASGRSDEVRKETMDWLYLKAFRGEGHLVRLVMRKAGDYTPDEQLKRSWLDDGTLPRERIAFVFDDRDKVVAMWRAEGLPCFQVAPGGF